MKYLCIIFDRTQGRDESEWELIVFIGQERQVNEVKLMEEEAVNCTFFIALACGL